MDLPHLFSRWDTGSWQWNAACLTLSAEFSRRGFAVDDPVAAIGGAQRLGSTGTSKQLIGPSDHRKDGCALGYWGVEFRAEHVSSAVAI
jgi:gamma-glutamyltranspeptidase/glutathione hydrolase